MVGYLEGGMIMWTFRLVDNPVLTDSGDRVSVTAVEGISAAGDFIPSFLIFPGVQIPRRWIENSLDGEVILTTSPKGYMNDIIALEWLQHFEKHTRPEDPAEVRVLLMDGCDSHYTSEFVGFARQNNIELFPVPPHLTHYLQPLDVGVFAPSSVGIKKSFIARSLTEILITGRLTS